jgi:hypothetical protein
MNNLIFRLVVFFFVPMIFLPSCTMRKKLSATRSVHINKISEREMEVLLKKNELKFNWIAARFSADASLDSSQISFNVSLRGRRDSELWLSMTAPLIGIEVARAIITKDSVKFMDRIHSQYFSGDFNFINKLLHADLDFDMLQSMLIGNSTDFYEDEEKLHSAVDDGRYLLSTIRKRKLRKVISRNKELKEPAQSIWLDPETFKIVHLLFNDFNQNRTFDAAFDKFDKIDSMLFPYQIHYSIKAEKNVDVKIEYSKVSINTVQTFPFGIPPKYERIIYREKQ